MAYAQPTSRKRPSAEMYSAAWHAQAWDEEVNPWQKTVAPPPPPRPSSAAYLRRGAAGGVARGPVAPSIAPPARLLAAAAAANGRNVSNSYNAFGAESQEQEDDVIGEDEGMEEEDVVEVLDAEEEEEGEDEEDAGCEADPDVDAEDSQSFQRVFWTAPATDIDSVHEARNDLEITVEGEELGMEAPPITSFSELTGILPEYVEQALLSNNMHAPLPIQAQALPLALGGQDLIGIAKTGSGKTLGFLLPAIVHLQAQLDAESTVANCPTVLVLAPVRELAVQIVEEAQKLLKGSGQNGQYDLRAVSLYGGGGRIRAQQVEEVRWGCHIVGATPGRLVDLVEAGDIDLSRVSFFVLDEADRMLDCGFGDQVTSIASSVRPDRQTLFFSATWGPEVQKLAAKMCHSQAEPVRITVGQKEDGEGPSSRTDIVQEVLVFAEQDFRARDRRKQQILNKHLRKLLADSTNKVLVFVQGKNLAWELGEQLCKEGFFADSMHGGRSQDIRLEVLGKFRTGELRLLVATDVMGRGIDIPDVTHVVVFDMGDVDDYVHRIGRTARGVSGRGGHALTFFEFDPKWPKIAGELAKVLEQAGQEVPEELQRVVDGVADGTLQSWDRSGANKWGKQSHESSWGKKEEWGKEDKPAGPTPCWDFVNLGTCKYGDECHFSHPAAESTSKRRRVPFQPSTWPQ